VASTLDISGLIVPIGHQKKHLNKCARGKFHI
jgi:hypothetical protein